MQPIEKIAEAVPTAAAGALSVEVFTTYFTFRNLKRVNTVRFFNCQANK